jgi:anti-anti-sigma regulatory factor
MVMRMATNAVWLKIDEQRLIPELEDAREKLDCADGKVVLDFSSVRRIDAGALTAMEKLAGIADEKAVKIVLRGVNVDIYKVLKLVKLSPRFSFLT